LQSGSSQRELVALSVKYISYKIILPKNLSNILKRAKENTVILNLKTGYIGEKNIRTGPSAFRI
jgi:hypothetical protein